MQTAMHSSMACLVLVFSILLLAVEASGHENGRSPAEAYWKMVLPNSPVPQAIVDLTPIDDSPAAQLLSNHEERSIDKKLKKSPSVVGYLTYASSQDKLTTTSNDERVKSKERKKHASRTGYLTYAASDDKTITNNEGIIPNEMKKHASRTGYLTYSTSGDKTTSKNEGVKPNEAKKHASRTGYLTYAAREEKPIINNEYAEPEDKKNHASKTGYLSYANSQDKRKTKPSTSRTGYLTYASSEEKLQGGEEQLHDKERLPVLFLERALRPGSALTLDFAPTTSRAAFVHRSAADSIPFSTAKLPEILSTIGRVSAVDADDIRSTLDVCERPVPEGGTAICATSLESLVDFAISALKTRDVRAVSSTVPEGGAPLQRYNITAVRKIGESDSFVGSHSVPYPYAVFFCHATGAARAYIVSLVGADGATAVDAVSVCHTDTSQWDPNHLAFQMLHVKRGTVPVCHFFAQNELVWLKN